MKRTKLISLIILFALGIATSSIAQAKTINHTKKTATKDATTTSTDVSASNHDSTTTHADASTSNNDSTTTPTDEATSNNDSTADDLSAAEEIPIPIPVKPNDPLESYNRHIFQFNRNIDKILIKPLAQIYHAIMPRPLEKGVNNFFNNINMITTIPNDILQGSLYHTCVDTTRFIINSTFGLAGFIDVASMGGIPCHAEDTGLTFAKWGYKCSAYFVLPLIGPCTIRDTIGLTIDYYAFSPYPYIRPWPVRYGVLSTLAIQKRAQFLDYDDVIKQASLDPYVFERDAYLQHRNFLIAENQNNCGCQEATPSPTTADALLSPGEHADQQSHQYQPGSYSDTKPLQGKSLALGPQHNGPNNPHY